MNELGVFLVTELELLVILCLVLCPIVYAVDSFGFLTYKSVVSFGVGCYVWSTLIAPLPTQPSFMGDPTLASVSGTILFPLPSSGYCPSVAYAIGYMMKQGYNCLVATNDGGQPTTAHSADLHGYLSGQLFPARPIIVDAYQRHREAGTFSNPVAFKDVDVSNIDGIFLPDGRREGMHEFLNNSYLKDHIIAPLWAQNKPFAAIGRGVLLMARTNSVNSENKRSILYHRKTTSLPKSMEIQSNLMHKLFEPIDPFTLTDEHSYVEDEIIYSLGHNPSSLLNQTYYFPGPFSIFWPFFHYSELAQTRSYFHLDENFVSGRFHGDVYAATGAFARMLAKRAPQGEGDLAQLIIDGEVVAERAPDEA